MKNTPMVRVIADRMHVCTACGEPIEINSLYSRWLVPDDHWKIEKRHPECVEDMRHLNDESPINSNE